MGARSTMYPVSAGVQSLLAAVATLAASACDEPAPPWAGAPDGRVIDESEPFLPSRRPALLGDAGAEGGAGAGGRAEDAPLPEEKLLARPAGRHGGMWMSCHDRFVASGEPRRDVTRLALSCGPVTGMHRTGGLVTGKLSANERAEHRFEGKAGHCYRVFAAGGDGIERLELRVVDRGGVEIARHSSPTRWTVVEPERPFCATTTTTFTVVADARGDSGPFAAEVWTIPPRERGL